MRPIGFSTGAVALADFREGLRLTREAGCAAVELSALRETELDPLLDSLGDLDLASFGYVSIHAPSQFRPGGEARARARLAQHAWRGWPIVLHPDSITDFAAWRELGAVVCIENMDKRKPIGRTAAELAQIFEQLPEATFCFDIGHSRQCDSTMVEAARLAESGAASGTIVGADEQTAGQGRLGRQWHSPPGAGLYVSFVVRASNAPWRTLAAGLAVREALRHSAGVECDMRWPNDLLFDGKKVCGILVNAESGALIVGVGVNLNQAEFPPEIAEVATSLRLITGQWQDRGKLLDTMGPLMDEWMTRTDSQVIAAFEECSSYARGKAVTAEDGLRGVTDGLDSQGFLMLKREDGMRVRILAGNVRPIA